VNELYKDYIPLFLMIKQDESICARCVFSIRNCNDYTCFSTRTSALFNTNSYKKKYYCCYNLIKKTDLNNESHNFSRSLIEDNKFAIDIYLRIYKNDIYERYLDELKYIMNNNNMKYNEHLEDIYIEWVIEDWNKFNDQYNDYNTWTILVYPDGFDESLKGYTSIYVRDSDLSYKDIRNNVHNCSSCIVTARNYNDYRYYLLNETPTPFYFSIDYYYYFINKFKKKSELLEKNEKTNKSIVENDKVVLGLYIRNYKYNREIYINELKHYIECEETDNRDIIGEHIYEWEIKDWTKLKDSENSPEFSAIGYKWRANLNGINNFNKEYVSASLENLSIKNNIFINIEAGYVISIRNCNDYSCYYVGAYSNCSRFDEYNRYNGYDKFIKKTDLYYRNFKTDRSLIENGRVIITVYVRVYRYDKENFIEDLKKSLNDNNENKEKICGERYYEWNVENFDKLKFHEISPIFLTGKYKWSISLFPKGKDRPDFLSIFLNSNSAMEENEDDDFYVHVYFAIAFRNYKTYTYYHFSSREFLQRFTKSNNNHGYFNYIKMDELYKNENSSYGLVEDNRAVVNLYIRAYRLESLENFLKNLKDLIKDDENDENKNEKIIEEDYFEYPINDWDKIDNEPYRTAKAIGITSWRILLYPNGKNGSEKDHLSYYIRSLDFDEDSTFLCTNIYIKYVLYIRNYNNYLQYKAQSPPTKVCFSAENKEHGFSQFIKKSEFYNENNDNEENNNHLLEDDKTVLGTYIRVYKMETVNEKESTISS
jgi:hypothetical protein